MLSGHIYAVNVINNTGRAMDYGRILRRVIIRTTSIQTAAAAAAATAAVDPQPIQTLHI